MKTFQDDWKFVTHKPEDQSKKLQENRLFHALSTAYENSQQKDLFRITQSLVNRERDLCETAISELEKVSRNEGEEKETLALLEAHYRSRFTHATDKQQEVNRLSEESQKMLEEYKSKTQELAEVKRNLMESQMKLRELTQATERLGKREEELRFIETNLRKEIEANKRTLVNSLYEIVMDIQADVQAEQSQQPQVPTKSIEPLGKEEPLPTPKMDLDQQTQAGILPGSQQAHEPNLLQKALAKAASKMASQRSESEAHTETPKSEEAPKSELGTPSGTGASKPSKPIENAGTHPAESIPPNLPDLTEDASPGRKSTLPADETELQQLLRAAESQRYFEPDREACAKSLVKTPNGTVIAEYFYSPRSYKNQRHYVFNTLYGVLSLLALRKKNLQDFHGRTELLLGDILTRLDQNPTIHLEVSLNEIWNRASLDSLLSSNPRERILIFDELSRKTLAKLEAMGKNRADLLESQLHGLNNPKA